MAKNSGPARIIHERTTGEEREKMIEVTKADIIKKSPCFLCSDISNSGQADCCGAGGDDIGIFC